MKKTKKKSCLILAMALAVSMLLFLNSSLLTYLVNQYSLVASTGYFIPYESSVWDFRPLVPNEGSGEYWLYGEDEMRYYYVGDDINYRYVSVLKKDAQKCPGFRPTLFKTWCLSNPPRERK